MITHTTLNLYEFILSNFNKKIKTLVLINMNENINDLLNNNYHNQYIMNRARAIKKDYQKILKALPQDNLYYNNENRYNYDIDTQHSPESKIKQICYTMGIYPVKQQNRSKQDIKLSTTKAKKQTNIYEKFFPPMETQISSRYKANKKTYQIEDNKRIKTLQRSIELRQNSQQRSFGSDRFKKKDLRPLKNKIEFTKNNPYNKKRNQYSLNVSREKNRSNIKNSNKNIKQSNLFSSKEDLSGIKQLRLINRSEIKMDHKSKIEQQLFSKGKQAYQNNEFSSSIQYFTILLDSSPDNIEANYLIGVSYLGISQYLKALKYFDKVLLLNQSYNKNLYILSTIALKKMSLHEQAYKKLTKCIYLFPQYYDAYIYRGKLKLKQKKYNQALKDFQTATNLNSKKIHGFIGNGDCYFGLNNHQKALQSYQHAIKLDPEIQNTLLLKIATSLKHLNLFEEGLKRINKYLQKQANDGDALFIRGYFLSNLKKYNEANMTFQQLLKLNDKKLSTKGLEQMIKIKICERDFYSAYHLIDRINFIEIQKSSLERVKMFTQAVVFLMKRKFIQSIQIFQEMDTKFKYSKQSQMLNDEINYFLKPLFHLYSGYGYFCLSQFQKSLEQYQNYHRTLINRKKQNKILQSSRYNKTLCQALLYFQKKEYSKSIQKLHQSTLIFPNKIQPYFYQGIIYIRITCLVSISEEQPLLKSLNSFSKAIQIMAQHSNNIIANVFYHRSVVYAYLSMWKQAIIDIDKAIQKSQDNIPKYFYLRGLIFGCCQSFKQAIHDLSICLNLNDAYAQAYLLRSKCLQIQGQANEAFLDLQRYITLKPQDQFIHKYAGQLLFENGAFEDSIQAYAHGDINDQCDSDIFLTRGKAYFLLGQFKNAHQDMKIVYKITKNQEVSTDVDIIQLISLMQSNKIQNYQHSLERLTKLIELEIIQGKIFKKKQFHMLKGGCIFYLNRYKQAIKQFEKCIQLKESSIKSKQSTEIDPQDIEQTQNYINHMKFNICLCYIMRKEFVKAKQICQKIVIQRQKSPYSILNNLINYEINQNINIDQNIKQIILQSKQLEVFSLNNKLSKHFCSFKPQFKLNPTLELKLCFSYPKVQPPEINPQFQKEILLSLDPSNIQNKPEAPWIRRSSDCIMFTSTIQVFDNLDLETQNTKRNEIQKQYPSCSVDNQFDQQSSQKKQVTKVEINKLKQKLKLEGDVQKKLNKLIKKN